ncbi:MAG: branched-chain amino acid ABC transporter permease, partial [Firmicutes bacterium]|nr:branched-chain amino acid ABC transporter permease [Bacillota bacterium]
MLGAFSSFYFFLVFGNNLLLGLVSGFVVAAVAGIAVYKICYERFLDAPRHIPLICTIGMSMLIKNLAQIVFGSEMKGMPDLFADQYIQLWDIRINFLQLMIIGVVILLSLVLSIFLNKTRSGMILRAVSQDKKAAALLGINVKKATLLGNCIGCSLGGVAGVLLGLYYNSVLPTMGSTAGLKAFSSAVLGGLTNIPGAALGGVLIGVLENLGIAVFSSGLRDVFAFVFLVLVLIIKP